MNHHKLKRLVALGEGYHLEFKRRVPHAERIAKEVIAFANSGGGFVLLGIDDAGEIVGVKDVEEEEFALRRSLQEHCAPPVDFTIERVPVTHKRDVLIVHVGESKTKPHFLISEGNGSPGNVYVRVHDKSVEASREVVSVLAAKNRPDNVQFEFGEKEHTLMKYLDQYERITVREFAKIAHISPRLASQTLVLLVRANILRLHPSEKADYFTLAYEAYD